MFCFEIRKAFEIRATGSPGWLAAHDPVFCASVSVLACLAVKASLISCARIMCFLFIYSIELYHIYLYNHGSKESEGKDQCSEEDHVY